MRLPCRLAIVVVLLAVGSGSGAAQDEAVPSDLLVKLERTACYGSCLSEVAAVLATTRRIGFFELRDSYRAMITDLPTTFVTITANGRTKKIEDYFGAPRETKQLEILIDEAARTQRWLKMQALQAPVGGPIEWSPERKLMIEDFRAAVPKSSQQANVRQGALSFLRLEASVECRDRRLIASARAVFLPSHSWWAGARSQMWERVRDSQSWLAASRQDLEMKTAIKDANEELLKHEQLHFDMAELAARKIRQRVTQSEDACARDSDAAELNRFVGDMTREFRQEQARYDQESKHGTFLFAQGKWESRVKAALSAE